MSVIERVRRINARPPAEESVALRVLVLVAVMASSLAVLGEGAGTSDAVLTVAVLVGLPAGYLFSHITRHHDGFWLKVGLAVLLLVAFGEFVRAVSRVQTGSVAEVQIPLAELFLWVQLLHAVDVPARRDLMFSVAASFALIAVAAVLSISLALAPFLVVWAVAAITSLVLAERSRLGELPRLAPPRARRTAALFAAARPVVVSLILVVALGTATFLVVPAAGSARSCSPSVSRAPSRSRCRAGCRIRASAPPTPARATSARGATAAVERRSATSASPRPSTPACAADPTRRS